MPAIHGVRFVILCAICCCALVSLAAAQANTPSQEPDEYRVLVRRGLEEYELGHYQEARDQFTRAHALFPNARTLRGLGLTAFELRNYIDAESFLERALADQTKPLEGQLRDETQDMLVRARSYVGGVVLQVQPKSAAVIVDGIRRPDAEAAGSLRLDVGDHVLEFRAQGWLAERRALRTQGGRTETLEISLTQLSNSSSDVPDSERSARPPLYKRWWLWTVVGVVAVGAATGLALALSNQHGSQYRAVPSDQTPDGVSIRALGSR